ncbi:MAG: VanZ family protein [Candidatus Moranbacteria bacterium]|nr:VanZ family protein [Candidatus Moranbacteria bacterium]
MGSREFWVVLLVLWMIEIFALSQIPGTSARYYDLLYFFERKIAHVVEFFVLALLAYRTFVSFGVKYKKALAGMFFLSMFWALIDEVHQLFIFGREGKLADVGIDGIGVLLFLIFLLAWRAYFRIGS